MPETYWREHDYPGKTYTLGHAAAEGRLLKVRCNECRRTVYYVAADLAQIYDPTRPAWIPQFPCSKCRSFDCVEIRPHTPSDGDYGNLSVRRPGPVRHIQTWRTEKLGDRP